MKDFDLAWHYFEVNEITTFWPRCTNMKEANLFCYFVYDGTHVKFQSNMKGTEVLSQTLHF